jgi:hypothetical protein
MDTLTVWVPGGSLGPTAAPIELCPGQEATFGRGSDSEPVDITLPDAAVSRLAGRIRAVEDHWVISNLSPTTTYVVENPEGAGEFVRVPPMRLDMPVPFEFARVVVPARCGQSRFHVIAPAHLYGEPARPGQRTGDVTTQAFPLDVTAKYFLVLVAMCEPALRDISAVAIPTAAEIVQRLAPLGSCRQLTVAAVYFHINYLATHKLRLRPPPGEGQAARADWQRAALVSLALRFNLVREEHLALLPSRRSPAATVKAPREASAAGRTPPGST